MPCFIRHLQVSCKTQNEKKQKKNENKFIDKKNFLDHMRRIESERTSVPNLIKNEAYNFLQLWDSKWFFNQLEKMVFVCLIPTNV